MTTNCVAYHPKTDDVALFESDGQFWVGSYIPGMTHQNGEPSYVLIRGYFDTAEQGIQVLNTLTGNEI